MTVASDKWSSKVSPGRYSTVGEQLAAAESSETTTTRVAMVSQLCKRVILTHHNHHDSSLLTKLTALPNSVYAWWLAAWSCRNDAPGSVSRK
jgi:hypothetical protein